MRYTTKRTKAAKVLSIRALCITILQNLREMRKFFADRSYQKGVGIPAPKYAKRAKATQPSASRKFELLTWRSLRALRELILISVAALPRWELRG